VLHNPLLRKGQLEGGARPKETRCREKKKEDRGARRWGKGKPGESWGANSKKPQYAHGKFWRHEKKLLKNSERASHLPPYHVVRKTKSKKIQHGTVRGRKCTGENTRS